MGDAASAVEDLCLATNVYLSTTLVGALREAIDSSVNLPETIDSVAKPLIFGLQPMCTSLQLLREHNEYRLFQLPSVTTRSDVV
jgi:hypothetical protein